MQSRREFLKNLGATLGIAAAAPYVFDMGANLYKRPNVIVTSGWIDYNAGIHMTSVYPTAPRQLGSIKIDGEEFHTIILSPDAIYDLISEMTQPVDEEFLLGPE